MISFAPASCSHKGWEPSYTYCKSFWLDINYYTLSPSNISHFFYYVKL